MRAVAQTAGRGREGRTWLSKPGNLYASTLVRLRPTDPAAATIALVAAVALQEAVATFLLASGVPLTIKWPNDLLIGGAKLAGILLERSGDAVVAGFGVNCAHHPDFADRTTTSLAEHGLPLDPAVLVEALGDVFARWIAIWRGEGLSAVRARWLDRAHPRGTALAAQTPAGVIKGLFDGLNADGALRLRLADGGVHVIHAADVFLL